MPERSHILKFKGGIHPYTLYAAYIVLLIVCSNGLLTVVANWLEAVLETPLPALKNDALFLNFFVFLLFALSIITSIINWQWFKRYWHVNTVIFIITGFLTAMLLFNKG